MLPAEGRPAHRSGASRTLRGPGRSAARTTFRGDPTTSSLYAVTIRDLFPRRGPPPVHSLPSPPRSARPTAVRPRHSRRRRLRLVPVVTVCGVAAGVALSVPVLQPVTDSFADTAVGLDSSSQWDHWGTSPRHQRSSVGQWDVDGAPAATATPSAATPPRSTTTDAPGGQPAPPTAAAPETTTDEQETATASSSSSSQDPAPQASTNASTNASTSASTGGSSKTST